MKALRVPIAGLMGLVVFAAIGFAGFRSGSELWFRSLYSATVVALLAAALGARLARGPVAAFWFGFTVVGWAHLVLGLGLIPRTIQEDGDVDAAPSVNPFLFTTPLVKRAFLLTSRYSNIKEVGEYRYSLYVGHLMATLLLAAAGGSIAAVLAVRRPEGPEPPAANPPRKKGPWAFALAAVLVPAVVALSRSSRGPYFPPLAFDTKAEHNRFVEAWYGKHLAAMGEPSLWGLSRRGRGAEVYRFLWLPSFHHPVCVRVERSGGSAVLTYVILDGAGGYEPGDVAVNRTRKLGPDGWDGLARLSEKAGFWALPTRDDKADSGCDGDQLIVEGVKDGRYHVVDRWSPSGGDYYNLCEYMLGLTGFDFREDWEGYHSPQ